MALDKLTPKASILADTTLHWACKGSHVLHQAFRPMGRHQAHRIVVVHGCPVQGVALPLVCGAGVGAPAEQLGHHCGVPVEGRAHEGRDAGRVGPVYRAAALQQSLRAAASRSPDCGARMCPEESIDQCGRPYQQCGRKAEAILGLPAATSLARLPSGSMLPCWIMQRCGQVSMHAQVHGSPPPQRLHVPCEQLG